MPPFFCQCVSLSRFTQWHFPAYRDDQLAISHRCGHEFERLPCRILRKRTLHSPMDISRRSGVFRHLLQILLAGFRPLLTNFIGSFSADRIRSPHPASAGIRNRRIVVSCEHLIRPDTVFARSICLLAKSLPATQRSPSRSLAVNTAERPTFPTAPTTITVWPALTAGSGKELVARSAVTSGSRRCGFDQIEPPREPSPEP